jgi:ATP-dependent DNA helicase RecG
MPTKDEVIALLDRLDAVCADDLEGQTLDFKEWDSKSYKDSGALILETAICLANGGGGTLVIGVKDKLVGRSKAILGVPADVDVNVLKKMVYEKTEPRLTPTFEELSVPEGTGRLIVAQVHRGMPIYTDRKGRAKVRLGKECQPFTGSMRQSALAARGEADLLAGYVSGDARKMVSAAGMEKLREIALKQSAPQDLLRKTDNDLLGTIGLVRSGRLTKAGLLLVGKEERIVATFPAYAWSYLRMKTGSDYSDRADGRECVAIALQRIEERIAAHNELTTVRQGLLHFEYRTYPEVAIREALLNAFVHADYGIPGLIQVKQFEDRLEITNPGGLVFGVAPDNILRHTPVSRNTSLVSALIPLRLVNRSNLGMHRMFEAMLQEGKEPPVIRDAGDSVRIIFQRNDFSFAFRAFVAEAANDGQLLRLEELLIMQYLLRHGEIDEQTAAQICQQEARETKEALRRLEKRRIVQSQRRDGSLFLQLRPEIEDRIAKSAAPNRIATAEPRILSALNERRKAGQRGLTNAEIRDLTGLDREQVKYVMQGLRGKGLAESSGRGRSASWSAAAKED